VKVLVTGITGFIGKRLLLQLGTVDEITVVSRKVVSGFPKNVTVIQADLNEPKGLFDRLKVIRPEACVHLAWEGIPNYGADLSRRNFEQGKRLLRHLVEECGCSKIIAAGSCWEYGKPDGTCSEEERPEKFPKVSLDFTRVKRSLSDIGFELARKPGMSFIWVRIFYAYGPGQREGSLIPTMTQALNNNECPAVKTPHNANDFIHVDDIAEALNLMVHKKNMQTGIYNLGTGKPTKVWEICEYLEKALGKSPIWSKQLRDMKVESTANFWADMSKTTDALGWSPKISIEEGLKRL